ncbi:MAG TPA: hypothetical protein VMU50_13000, partial [Polyangia bacterium]|nr:hypothetical protein [Polyangia bacterium]
SSTPNENPPPTDNKPTTDAAAEAPSGTTQPPPEPVTMDAGSSQEVATTPPPPETDAAVDTGGTTGGGDAGGPTLTAKDFTCSWVVGITTTGEWYRSGFENVVDNARWQNTHVEMGHLEKWADPANGIWNVTIDSPCAMNSKTPDRVVFSAVKYEWTTMEEFLPAYISAIKNFLTKYPSIKQIWLMTYERAPMDMQCNGANRPTYSWIKPVQDQVAAMMPAMFPGIVYIAPKWEVDKCSDFGLCPHLSGAANMAEAKKIGEFFLTN